MFGALRQREPGAQSLSCSTTPALGKGPLGRSDTLCKNPGLRSPLALCKSYRGKKAAWMRGVVFPPEAGKEVETILPLGLPAATTPDSWSVCVCVCGGGSSSFPVPILEIGAGRHQARRVFGTGTCGAWCSFWNCCPRTSLNLTLPQGNSFAQLPSLLIPPPFPVLPDYSGLGSLGVVRPSIFVEEVDLLRPELKLG